MHSTQLGIYDENGLIQFLIHPGMNDDTVAGIGSLPNVRGLLGAMIVTGPIRLDDLGADPRLGGFPPNHPPMRAFLGVPVTGRGDGTASFISPKRSAADRLSTRTKRS